MFADIASANIVGYAQNNDASVSQNNFLSVAFATVGCNTCDIQQIQLTDPSGELDLGQGGEIFSIWEGVPSVVEGSEYLYWAPEYGDGEHYFWGDDGGEEVAYSFAAGQSVTIDMPAGIVIQTAGEVLAKKVTLDTIAQNNFIGNPFPAEISIQNIQIEDPDGVADLGQGGEIFSVWEGVPSVVEGSEYLYWAPEYGDGEHYFWGDDGGEEISYSIPAGKGFVIDCAAGLKVNITPSYSL